MPYTVTFLGEVKSPVTSQVELCGVTLMRDRPALVSDAKWAEMQAHPQFDQFEFSAKPIADAKPNTDAVGKVRSYSSRGKVGIAINGPKT